MDVTIEENIRSFFKPEERLQLAITPVQGDASTRRYYRILRQEGSMIACHDPLLKECAGISEYPFLVMHDLLAAHNLPVPAVLAVDARKSLLLLEDCGTIQLQDLADVSGREAVADLYRDIIDALVRIQSITGEAGKVPFNLAFDREKLMLEFDFFIEHALLNYFSGSFDRNDASLLRIEFESITDILVKPEQFVLNHRDFHSRNIMIRDGRPVIIDFQDARMGLAQYDAVSLIRDSYVTLDRVLSEELKTLHYRALADRNCITTSFDEYLYLFDLMAFQRNIKAIGTFCYQTAVLNKTQYEHSIAPTLAYLPDYIAQRAELKKAGKLLMPLIDARQIR
ncbi:aminoglycoside phosphotransferase family protein [Chlorobium sp.]|uniref:aminoglycoside phosphotransferase family protein n=1 Tax=Chlorobium sp. TaxID=1095 RepID=UPI002F3E4057